MAAKPLKIESIEISAGISIQISKRNVFVESQSLVGVEKNSFVFPNEILLCMSDSLVLLMILCRITSSESLSAVYGSVARARYEPQFRFTSAN